MTKATITPGEPSRPTMSQASTLRAATAIVTRQLRDHVRSARLPWAIITTLVLAFAATLARTADYRDAYASRSEASQTWLPTVVQQLQRDEAIQVDNMRSVSPLGVIAVGLDSVVPIRFSSTKEGVRFGEARASQSATDTLFGQLDLSFVFGAIVSLLTLTFSFDGICGERRDGTLMVVLASSGEHLPFFLAKWAAATIAGSVCVLSGTLIAIAFHQFLGMRTVEFASWLEFVGLSIVYVAVFAAIGILVSASFRDPSSSLVACVAVWVSLVYVAPRIVAASVNALVPPQRAASVAIETEMAISKLKIAKARADRLSYEHYLAGSGPRNGSGEELQAAVARSARTLDEGRRALTNRLLEREEREDDLRNRYIAAAASFIPPVSFFEVSSEIARTGRTQKRQFFRDARIYDDEIGRRLVESRHVIHGGPETARRVVMLVDDVRAHLIPFETRWVSSEQVTPVWVRAIVAYCVLLVILIMFGLRVFRRSDTRP